MKRLIQILFFCITILVSNSTTYAGIAIDNNQVSAPTNSSKSKSKKTKYKKHRTKRHKNKGFIRSILSFLLLLLIIFSGLSLLILPWLFTLTVWFFIGVVSILLLTTLLLMALNDTPKGPRWMRPISEGIQGCLSALVIIVAIGAIITLTFIAIFGPAGLAYLAAVIGLIGFIGNMSENISAKKRRKKFEQRQTEKENENSTDPK